MKKYLLLIFFILFFSSCVTTARNYFYIKTETVPNLSLPYGTTFFILINNKTTIEEQKAIRKLQTKLEESGYKVTTDINETEYRIILSMDTRSYSSTTQVPFPSTKTTYHRGSVGGSRYSGLSVSNETKYIPLKKTYSYKKYYLDLYKYDREIDENILVWTSFASIVFDKYAQYEDKILALVTHLIGRDYEGP